jgi:hypothetical protein
MRSTRKFILLNSQRVSGEKPEDWDMECCMCEHPLEFVRLPMSEEKQRIRQDIDIHELTRLRLEEGWDYPDPSAFACPRTDSTSWSKPKLTTILVQPVALFRRAL